MMKKNLFLFLLLSVATNFTLASGSGAAKATEKTEKVALEEEEGFVTPPSTPKAKKALKDLRLKKAQITPERSRERAVSASQISKGKGFSPLTLEEIKLILNYHKENYLYPLLRHSFYKNFASLKMKIREIASESEDHNEFLFHTYEQHGHWSLLWALRSEETNHELVFVYLDSVGYEGKYKRLLLENLLEELWSRGSEFTVKMPAVKRQRDNSSCALFAINDFRTLSLFAAMQKEKIEAGEEAQTPYSLFATIEEKASDIHDNFSKLTTFPDILMQPSQSISAIKANCNLPEGHVKSSEPYHMSLVEGGKEANFFTDIQQEQCHEVIDLQRQREEEEELEQDGAW